eukprot:gene2247-2461_t
MSSALNPEDDEWEKAEASLAALSMSEERTAQEEGAELTEEPIDSALLSAMDNPRERMALFQIEDSILKFVRSSDRMMEMPPGLNSFRRLLTHRVGQRFGLNRTVSDAVNEYGERGIILYKTLTTTIPRTLLIDHYTRSCAVNANAAASAPSTSAGSSTPAPSADAPVTPSSGSGKEPKKIMVMKRRSDNGMSASGKFSANKTVATSEDREKAYLEARARIFGESVQPGEDNEAVCVPTAPALVSDVVPVVETIVAPPVVLSGSSFEKIERTASGGSVSPPPTITVSRKDSGSSTGGGPVASGGSGKGRVVDVGQWKEKKSQLRNVEAEKADPDFKRRGHMPMPPVPGYGMNDYARRAPSIPVAPALGGMSPYYGSDLNPNVSSWKGAEYYDWSYQQGQPPNGGAYFYYPSNMPGTVPRGGYGGQSNPQSGNFSQSDFPPLS